MLVIVPTSMVVHRHRHISLAITASIKIAMMLVPAMGMPVVDRLRLYIHWARLVINRYGLHINRLRLNVNRLELLIDRAYVAYIDYRAWRAYTDRPIHVVPCLCSTCKTDGNHRQRSHSTCHHYRTVCLDDCLHNLLLKEGRETPL